MFNPRPPFEIPSELAETVKEVSLSLSLLLVHPDPGVRESAIRELIYLVIGGATLVTLDTIVRSKNAHPPK
jgi:hypothetical protein